MAAALTADRVLRELQELWASLAQTSKKPDSAGVLRACSMTLIVVQEESADTVTVGETLGQVMQEYPHRAVVVRVCPSRRSLEHRVTAQCWMPAAGRQQVCCEQVEIMAGEQSLAGVTPILAALSAPDLPLVIWCRNARLLGIPALRDLFGRAGKVIVDRFPLADLAQHAQGGLRIADLAWTAITRWREAVAQIFEDASRHEWISALREVRVLYGGEAVPTTAQYLAAWVIDCAGRPETGTRFESTPAEGNGIEGLILNAGSHTVSIRRAGQDAALIEIDALRSCTTMPRMGEADLLKRELGIAGHDAVFERVLPRAAALAEG